jgi:hypothetical protein
MRVILGPYWNVLVVLLPVFVVVVVGGGGGSGGFDTSGFDLEKCFRPPIPNESTEDVTEESTSSDSNSGEAEYIVYVFG